MTPTGSPEMSSYELQSAIVSAAAASGQPVLDAGRGQPNWLATTPRAAAHLLGLFAVADAQTASDDPLWGKAPLTAGIADRLDTWLGAANAGDHGAFLREAVAYGVDQLGFDRDAWVHELVIGVLGSSYATPTRMLTHIERVVERYIEVSMCSGAGPGGSFNIFGTEGGAAAMAYVFRSLRENHLVAPGDAIAISTPIFTPYLQIPVLEAFGFDVVELPSLHNAPGRLHDEVFERLLDPKIKAFFLVNPGNPDSRALRPESMARMRTLVTEQRPDLVVVTDTVYATFVDDFRSLVAEIPRNVICVHSYSKHFGATGARLGFVAVHEDTELDTLIAARPETDRAAQLARYSPVVSDVPKLPFIQRMVADSREVALHNIAGLATPDQVQMALFSLYYLTPAGDDFFAATRAMLHSRLDTLMAALGVSAPGGSDSAYYSMVDVLAVAERHHGAGVAARLRAEISPSVVPIRLAAKHGVIVHPGQIFGASGWDFRLSLASLDAASLEIAGRAIVDAVAETVAELPPA